MTEKRLALIIANYEYDDDGLRQLITPAQDADGLANVLRKVTVGGFHDVTTFYNESLDNVRRAIGRFFSGKNRNDLLLLYFSGHGLLDKQGRLYLAVKDTERGDLLRSTAVAADFITDEMNNSRSRRQVLILDCCHSGAVTRTKGGIETSVGTATAFEGIGYGRVILTATDTTQYAWEGDQVTGEAEKSVFTDCLIRGLQTGDADTDRNGWISIDELYDYVYKRVVIKTPRQTPGKWSFKQQGEIIIARNPELAQLFELPWPTHEYEPTTVERKRAKLVEKAASLASKMEEPSSKTTSIMAQAIVSEGIECLMRGLSPILLRHGLEKATSLVSAFIEETATQTVTKEEIISAVYTRVQDPKIGDLIAGIVSKADNFISILVQDEERFFTEVKYMNGFRFPQGYVSPYFITDPDAQEAVMEEPCILITDHKISNAADLTPLLEELITDHKRDLVLIAEDVAGEALSTLALNNLRGVLNALVVKAPGYGGLRDDMLQDMAILTGATMISKRTGRQVNQTEVSELGRAEKVIATKHDTLIVGGKGDARQIADRIEQVRAAMEMCDDEEEMKRLRERLSLLGNEIAVIRVGAETDARREKRRRQVSDAMAAMRASVAGGIIAGGGVPLLIGIAALDDFHTELRYERIGVDILRAALKDCLSKTAAHAGLDCEEIIESVRSLVQETGNRNIGLNVFDGEYVDMLEAGVIEPTQIVLRSFEDAYQSALAALGLSNSVGSASAST